MISEVSTSGVGNSVFTELRNIDDQTLDISGWQISACGSSGSPIPVTTVPFGTTLAPKGQTGQYLLLAPTAAVTGPTGQQVATDIIITTTVPDDGGWQVADQFGAVVDSVGFGNNGCVETDPAPQCGSLAATRDADGTDPDDNSADFTCEIGTPINSMS